MDAFSSILTEKYGKKEVPKPSLSDIYYGKKPDEDYGLRVDKTKKGLGYFGELPMTDGSGKTATEISIGVNFDGKERLIPLLVPNMTPEQRKWALSGGEPTKAMINAAVQNARDRMNQGKDPFAQSGEQIPPTK